MGESATVVFDTIAAMAEPETIVAMSRTVQIVLVALGVLLLLWAGFVAALALAGRRSHARALAGFVPDCAVLFKRLVADPRVARVHKLALVVLGAYLAMPFDLVPDFIPVAGQLDDAILVALVLLSLGLLAFLVYLTLRSRASFNILRAAYPGSDIRFRYIWASYWAGYGFNNVIPARGGDVIRLFLTKTSVPGSSYSAVAAAFVVEAVYDATIAVVVLGFAFTQGVFPKPPDFSKLNAFDLSYFASHPKFALFVLTALAIGVIALTALLSARVRAFWARVRQGLTILFDRRRYLREVWLIQFCGWLFRFTAFWS